MTYQLQKVAVFCGSAGGRNSAYAAAARELGKSLAKRNMDLVFGGGSIGLMGELSFSALKARGRVLGSLLIFYLRRKNHLMKFIFS